MPNKSDNIITELNNLTIGSGPAYSYSLLTIDSNRSHASQIQVLFYYNTLGDGTAVADVDFANWYTPFVLPQVTDDGQTILTFDSTTRTVTIGNTSLVTVTDINGTEYNLPSFAEGSYVRILRSQNVTNKSQVFGPGSRVTSVGLNNAVGQVFNSVQELDTRVNNLEAARFEENLGFGFEDLSDVDVAGASTWDVLRWSGTKWTNDQMDASRISQGTLNNDRLSNIPVSKLLGTLADSQLTETNVTQFASEVAAAIQLNEISNVNAVPVADGAVLSYNQSIDRWVPVDLGGGAGDHGALGGLSDDDHTQYALADGSRGSFEASGAVSTHAAITTGVHGISAFGATLIDDANAAAARTTLGLGTASTNDTGDFEAAGSISTHAAITSGVHGISAFGATLIDDADAAAARTTLGLGTAATSNTGDFAAASHTHDAGDITSGIFSILRIPDLAASKITSGTFANARISSSSVTQHAGDIDLLDLGNVTATIYGTGAGIYYDGANWVAGALTASQIPTLTLSKISDAGTAAASDTGDFAAASHTHTVSEISDLSDPVTSPSMTGVAAGSITGIIKCSQAQYDAITPVSTILYVIV